MCVSPRAIDLNETRCTLDFGQRAKQITTNAHMNIEVSRDVPDVYCVVACRLCLSCHYVKTLRDFGVSLLSLLTFPRIYQPLTGPAEGQGGFIPPPPHTFLEILKSY